ncbi:MAG: nitroreductase family protein [Oscillospiraceae bacterium]
MTDLQAINERSSRRTYLVIPIESEKLLTLQKLISEINRESQLTIEIIENAGKVFSSLTKTYGMFNGVNTIISLKGEKSDEHLKEKTGYYGEKIVLEATKLGLGTCFVGATFDKKSPELNLKDNEELICVITIGNVPNGRNIFENIMYKIMHEKTKSIGELISCDVQLPDWIRDGIIAVQKAPSALNFQKVKFSFERGELRAYVMNESLFNLVDLGIAKLHFEIAAGGKFSIGNYAIFTK